MEPKHITTRAVLKAEGDDEGTIEAVFSTFNVVDRGGDIVLPDAIEHNKEVPMVWSHDWSRPVGKGVTVVEADRAVFKGRFFMDTAAGLDAYRTVKAMGDLQEYSWGFMVNDYAYEQRGDATVRLIKSTELFEVSPVLVGEGRNTGTLSVKHGQPFQEQCDAVLAAVVSMKDRWVELVDLPIKVGKPISEARRTRIKETITVLESVRSELQAILDETEPAKAFNADALLYDYLLTQARANGVAA